MVQVHLPSLRVPPEDFVAHLVRQMRMDQLTPPDPVEALIGSIHDEHCICRDYTVAPCNLHPRVLRAAVHAALELAAETAESVGEQPRPWDQKAGARDAASYIRALIKEAP